MIPPKIDELEEISKIFLNLLNSEKFQKQANSAENS
jgi:hypothetical protein